MPESGIRSIATEPVHAGSGAWVHGIFVSAAAGSGLFFYLLSQSLQPALESTGLNGIWFDVCLLVGGLAGLWRALSPPNPSRRNEAVAES